LISLVTMWDARDLATHAAQVVVGSVGRQQAQPGAEAAAAIGVEGSQLTLVVVQQLHHQVGVDLLVIFVAQHGGEAVGHLADAAVNEPVVALVEGAPGSGVIGQQASAQFEFFVAGRGVVVASHGLHKSTARASALRRVISII
jgi:hypothetical protein